MSVQKGTCTPPRMCQKPPRWLLSHAQGGLSIASAGGVRGASDKTLSSTSGLLFMLSKAPRLYSYAPPARDRKPQRASHPHGFRAGQKPETGQGSLRHVDRAALDGFSSLRLQDWVVSFLIDFLPFSTSSLQARRRSGSGNDPHLKDLSQSF